LELQSKVTIELTSTSPTSTAVPMPPAVPVVMTSLGRTSSIRCLRSLVRHPHPAGGSKDHCDADCRGQPTIAPRSSLGLDGVVDQLLDLVEFAAVTIRPRCGPRQMCPPVFRAPRIVQCRPFAAGGPTDIQAACGAVGAAVYAVNPGVIEFCPGPINNAGTTHRNKPLMEVTEAEFDRIFAVNVKSILLTAQAFVPHMRSHGGGVFINIGSTAALRPRPGLTVYNSSKGAVHLMTKSMAVELAPDKIRVCALAPVAGETPLLAMFMGEDTPEKRAAFKATVPLGRFSKPEDIGLAALYLASDDANFLTGVVLEVDGGRCI